jgi:hypothetical protein
MLPLQDNTSADAKIVVTKTGPSASVEPNTEFPFTLAADVVNGSISSMVMTDTIDASTGITFLRVSPDTGVLLYCVT